MRGPRRDRRRRGDGVPGAGRRSRRLGGLTGDVYGMGIELLATVALVVGATLAHWPAR